MISERQKLYTHKKGLTLGLTLGLTFHNTKAPIPIEYGGFLLFSPVLLNFILISLISKQYLYNVINKYSTFFSALLDFYTQMIPHVNPPHQYLLSPTPPNSLGLIANVYTLTLVFSILHQFLIPSNILYLTTLALFFPKLLIFQQLLLE